MDYYNKYYKYKTKYLQLKYNNNQYGGVSKDDIQSHTETLISEQELLRQLQEVTHEIQQETKKYKLAIKKENANHAQLRKNREEELELNAKKNKTELQIVLDARLHELDEEHKVREQLILKQVTEYNQKAANIKNNIHLSNPHIITDKTAMRKILYNQLRELDKQIDPKHKTEIQTLRDKEEISQRNYHNSRRKLLITHENRTQTLIQKQRGDESEETTNHYKKTSILESKHWSLMNALREKQIIIQDFLTNKAEKAKKLKETGLYSDPAGLPLNKDEGKLNGFKTFVCVRNSEGRFNSYKECEDDS
jgi:hypothetical protein